MTPTADELSRGVEFARRREAARWNHWRREADRTGGVYFSGMGAGPFQPLTEAQIEREGLEWARRFAKARAEAQQGKAA